MSLNTILENRRRDCGVTIEDEPGLADIMERLKRSITFITEEPEKPQPKRQERPLTPLNQMHTDWLDDPQQKELYGRLLADAQQWVAERPSSPGLSFVITGPQGTGKSTILRNLMQTMSHGYDILDDTAVIGSVSIFAGRCWASAEVMHFMAPETEAPWYHHLRGIMAVVINDLGKETIGYAGKVDETNFIMTRQHRYHQLIDYCYEKGISLLINSNIPVIINNDSINPEFVDIMGEPAFDRIEEMAGKYIYDLSGFPTFRRWKTAQRLAQ